MINFTIAIWAAMIALNAAVRNTLVVHVLGAIDGEIPSISISSAQIVFALLTRSSHDGLNDNHTAFSPNVSSRDVWAFNHEVIDWAIVVGVELSCIYKNS